MCGIAGLISLDGRPLPGPQTLQAMCASIVHRGPDDQGTFQNDWAAIGMRRLAIIDVAGGHQPVSSAGGRIQVVFNGEIYNFRELRRELETRGYVFQSHSDSEVIAHAYAEYGTACFERLRGMFAIAVVDQDRRRLVLARDRIGKKPLYVGELSPGLLGFGSELKTLLAVPGWTPQLSMPAVQDFFSLGYIPAPDTIFEGIAKLPPAHWMSIEPGRDGGAPTIQQTRYAHVDFQPKWTDDEATLEERLLAELDDAVKVRLVSDVPFGAFLSGGLDSSVVCALMTRHLSQPLKTFSIGFEEAAFDELPDARRVAEHLGTEHHELVVRADATGLLDTLAHHFDEPFGDSSAIPTYLVSQLAAKHVKMVLSGDGGDELFAGYSRYRRYAALQRIRRSTLGMGPGLARLAGALIPGAKGRRLAGIGQRMGLPWPDDYLALVGLASPADLGLLFGERAKTDPFGSIRQRFVRSDIDSDMERILSGDMDTYLADDILTKVDRTTMAVSLEGRAPLLDQNLIAFAARLPFDMKLRGEQGKYLFRKVAARLLPADVLNKRKQGFAIPLASWFRTDLKPMLLDTIGSRAFRERGLFSMQGIQTLVDEHQQGLQDRGELLWMVMVLETWLKTLPEQRPRPPVT
ncbi:asparagine synthase (glutamine-hydrolyzing) [Lautropia dentalis]|jgi:asparagine synthase (glutamine-hydrolyzing)|uniref:asparagine synthase (glutamine-hydrolyzing) n=1 Tax=Lautropia dentalis TaxID=2490857 RepID=A0A426FMH3_9BURK|nr:asparagine synthase (glutamine-hydrolyzing) [Lautropia dentalis]RRN43887.1 asparagine synthase (glutamine-hydrolyzing) [Lautropia dentalis]